MDSSKLVYLGIKGSVLALNSATGVQVWSVKLKGSEFVNVTLLDGDVLAATSGEVFCLDAQTGGVRWHNPLKGYGLGLVSMAGAGIKSEQMVGLAEKRKREVESSSASVGAARLGL